MTFHTNPSRFLAAFTMPCEQNQLVGPMFRDYYRDYLNVIRSCLCFSELGRREQKRSCTFENCDCIAYVSILSNNRNII